MVFKMAHARPSQSSGSLWDHKRSVACDSSVFIFLFPVPLIFQLLCSYEILIKVFLYVFFVSVA